MIADYRCLKVLALDTSRQLPQKKELKPAEIAKFLFQYIFYERIARINRDFSWCILLRIFAAYLMCLCNSARPYVRSFMHLFVRSSVRPSIRSCVRPSVRPNVCSFIGLFVCPTVRPSIDFKYFRKKGKKSLNDSVLFDE